jgi:hypothetical protein
MLWFFALVVFSSRAAGHPSQGETSMVSMIRWTAVGLCLAVAPLGAAHGAYSIKTAMTPVPKEIKEPIARLLSDRSIQFLDDKGNSIGELWFRTEIPAKATPAQVKNGLTYREVDETTLLGAMRLDQQITDYRKQKIKAGVYTLRLGFQPMDGDHMGTAPYPEFCLLIPAADDEKPDTMAPKELQEMSGKSTGASHPGVLLLYPNNKPEETPKLVSPASGTWVLNLKEPVKAGDQKAVLGIGLTLVGHSEG